MFLHLMHRLSHRVFIAREHTWCDPLLSPVNRGKTSSYIKMNGLQTLTEIHAVVQSQGQRMSEGKSYKPPTHQRQHQWGALRFLHFWLFRYRLFIIYCTFLVFSVDCNLVSIFVSLSTKCLTTKNFDGGEHVEQVTESVGTLMLVPVCFCECFWKSF